MRMRENPRQLTVNVDVNVTATGTATAMADYLAQNYVCLMIPGGKKKISDPHDISLPPGSEIKSNLAPQNSLQIPSTNQSRMPDTSLIGLTYIYPFPTPTNANNAISHHRLGVSTSHDITIKSINCAEGNRYNVHMQAVEPG